MLKITGKQIVGADEVTDSDSVIEFITAGQLASRGGITRISYEETELSGLDGCTTSLIISGDKVKMRRRGDALVQDAVMVFEPGRRYEGLYETPMGSVGLEILTNNVTGRIDEEGGPGKLTIDYSVSLKGLLESRNQLDIEVLKVN